jgi:hexosaminidase
MEKLKPAYLFKLGCFRKQHILFFVLTLLFYSLPAQINLIPKPQQLSLKEGHFVLSSSTEFDLSNEQNKQLLELLNEKIKLLIGIELKGTKPKFSGNFISFQLNNELKPEEYKINIDEKSISVIHGKSAAQHAISTLVQLFYLTENEKAIVKIPCMSIEDAPVFKWRGMHLDVSRHFFSTAFLKKYIDILSLYKMNSFHWHLTDDQGWRIEIKKYPKLTSVGGWRKGSMTGHYRDQKIDTLRYGGFYTQDEIREVVAYASARNINVVPEIEMPGHSLAALSAYPELACNDSSFSAAKTWGVFDDVYCTKEETFAFMEGVLEEVCSLFPSEYIHIGGDEVPKTRWKSCEKCQQQIKSNGLKNEEELQSYFIRRIEKFINSKGKKIIGWDEILEGGLAPNAAVMSWRGTEGGVHAAKLNHEVVMSPGSHCYFDHYQSTPEFEPIAIGGFTTIQKVYQYDPIPPSLNEEEKKYIMGAQGNVWTEYITTTNDVERMAVPRMIALAEILWTKKENCNWEDFSNRLHRQKEFLRKAGIHFSESLYDIFYKSIPNGNNDYSIELQSQKAGKIYYTLNGKNPTAKDQLYSKPISISDNSTLKAALFQSSDIGMKVLEKKFLHSLSSGKKIRFVQSPSKYYPGEDGFNLVNGIIESVSEIRNKCTGWCNEDADFEIDLGKICDIKKISIFYLSDKKNKINPPQNVIFSFSEKSGGNEIKNITHSNAVHVKSDHIVEEFQNCKARYVHVRVLNPHRIASNATSTETDSWIMLDEICIE